MTLVVVAILYLPRQADSEGKPQPDHSSWNHCALACPSVNNSVGLCVVGAGHPAARSVGSARGDDSGDGDTGTTAGARTAADR